MYFSVGVGLVAVLAQEDDDWREHVLEFASRTCQGTEPSTYEDERLAKLNGIDKLSEYDFAVRYRTGATHVNADCLSIEFVEGDPTEQRSEPDGRGELSPEVTVRHAAAYCCAAAESSRRMLSAWARQGVLGAAQEGAADGDMVAITRELSAGPRRGDPWVDAEAMAELPADSINSPQPYARYTWRKGVFLAVAVAHFRELQKNKHTRDVA
eukprot:jgi/Tetstr1/448846/TSEL_036072.t1